MYNLKIMHVHCTDCITCTLLNYIYVRTVHRTLYALPGIKNTLLKQGAKFCHVARFNLFCFSYFLCISFFTSNAWLYGCLPDQSRFMLFRWKSCSVTSGARIQHTVTSTGECSFVLDDFLCNRLLFRVGHPFDFICVADCFVDIVRFCSEVPRFHLTSLHASLITLHLHVCSFNVRGTCSKSDDGAAEIRIGSTSQRGGCLSGTDCSCWR